MRQEIQAILLAAGPGSRMSTLNVKSKSLLPVGLFPMVYYPLKFLEDNGFEEATVIINQRDEKDFKKLNDIFGLKMKLDFAYVDTSNDPGTVDSIKQIENKIKKDVDEVLILSSDLLTDASLHNILVAHRSKGAAVTILTADQRPEYVKATPPGPKTKSTLCNDIICFEEGTSRIVYSVSAGDYDEQLTFSSKILKSVEGGLDIRSDVLDAHLYLMKRWVLDYVLSKDSRCVGMGSLKAEVIPHLISEQFLKVDQNLSKNTLVNFVKKERYEDLIRMYNTSSIPSRFQMNSKLDSRSCFSYHHPGFCVRVNTAGALWLANRKVKEISEKLKIQNFPAVSSEHTGVSEKAQICPLSCIGKSCHISERTNLTNSIVGEHCRISPKVRLVNSVLFGHVEIAEGCIIENSFVCVSVNKRCTIKNSIVTDSSKVEVGGLYENELLEAGLSQDYS